MQNKYKNKTKERILVPPEDIPNELYQRLRRYSTVKINSDNVKLLINYPSFTERIAHLRNSFSIPRLSRQKDKIKPENPSLNRKIPRNLPASSCYFRPDPQSRWFNSLQIKQQISLEEEIDQVLQEFNRPLTFDWRVWLIFYLLYNNEKLYRPLYNFEPLIPSPKAPLTTDEKRALRKVIKFRKKGGFGLNNNKKMLKKILKEYKKALKTKNELRPLRNIELAIRDIELREEIGEIYKDDFVEDSYRIAPLDLVGKIWKEVKDTSKKADLKRYQNLRKIRERFEKSQAERLSRKKKNVK